MDPCESLYGFDLKGVPNVLAARDFHNVELKARYFTPIPGQELHMKLIVVKRKDGSSEFATGSTNWTTGAFEGNFETFFFCKGFKAISKRLQDMFEKDWSQHSRPTHLNPSNDDEATKMALFLRFTEGLVEAFADQLF